MRLSWQYIAGFFDGEGCITTSTGMTTRIGIAQTKDRGFVLLSLIKDYIAQFGVKSSVKCKSRSNPKHAECWSLFICDTSSCVTFLEKIIPYLHIKKVYAEDRVRFLKWYAVGKRFQRATAAVRLADYNRSPEGIARAKKPNAGQFKTGHRPTRWSKQENEHVQ